MPSQRYKIKATVWLYPGATAAWHFVTIPRKESDDIKERFGKHAKGWGSLPVKATIGKTTWTTSIFPDKKAGAYLLPLKASVRDKERIRKGDQVTVALNIL